MLNAPLQIITRQELHLYLHKVSFRFLANLYVISLNAFTISLQHAIHLLAKTANSRPLFIGSLHLESLS